MTDDKKTGYPTVNVTSNYQSGGITAHTVNLNVQPQRMLGDVIKEKLLLNVPRDKLTVVWVGHGDQEAFRYGSEIFAFLKLNGFNLFDEKPVNNFFLSPVYGLTVVPYEDRTEITVGTISDAEIAQARSPF